MVCIWVWCGVDAASCNHPTRHVWSCSTGRVVRHQGEGTMAEVEGRNEAEDGAKELYYGVRRGRKTGVCRGWKACRKLVKGVPGSAFRSFRTQEEAQKYVDGPSTSSSNEEDEEEEEEEEGEIRINTTDLHTPEPTKKRKRKEATTESPTDTRQSDSEVEEDEGANQEMRKLLRTPRYFDPPEDSALRCFRCGGSGHLAKNCTEQEKKKPCFLCGKYGHQKSDCPNFLCFRCHQPGHQAKDCPVQANELQQLKICLRCGRAKCTDPCDVEYLPQDLLQVTCLVCQSKGHLCCEDKLGHLPRRSCLNCGQTGHSVDSCSRPARNQRTDWRRESTVICYHCSQTGHIARNCPRMQTMECWTCGKEGHTAIECPYRGFL